MFTKLKDEQPVVAVTLFGPVEDIGAERAKALPPGSRYRYSQSVTYTLQDGVQFTSRVTGITKPKLRGKLSDTQRHIDNRQMFADQWQNDAGDPLWCTTVRFTVDLRR